MPRVTRTVNPLHFEDLEPHRFEDLVRQLIYDFRPWIAIEAVGRKGADEGIDIRAVAVADDTENGSVPDRPQQTWIVQCKRETRIGPRQVAKYVRETLQKQPGVYGFLLAAPSDFTLKARETFRAEVASCGVTEAHLWGKAELEDRLFSPSYDRLLFAYFGFSLNVRRSSARTELSRRIALKRKLVEIASLRDGNYRPVLLRDPNAEKYPFIDSFDTFKTNPRWMYYEPVGHYPVDHLSFNVHISAGWADVTTDEWDILPSENSYHHHADRLFGGQSEWTSDLDHPLYSTIPEEHRINLRIVRKIHYDRILAVDELGDAFNEGPHLLVEYDARHGFFDPGFYVQLLTPQGSHRWLDPRKQAKFFPRTRSAG